MRTISRYTELSGCVAWFDTLAGLTLSGSELIAWADQSGAGLTLPATKAEAIAGGLAAVGPQYVASDPEFSGKPTLTWGTGETCLDAPLMAVDLAMPLTFLCCATNTAAITASSRNMVSGPNALVSALRRCAISTTASSVVGVDAEALLIQFGPTDFTKFNLPAKINTPFVACFAMQATGLQGSMRSRASNNNERGASLLAAGIRAHAGWRMGRGSQNASANLNWIGKFNAFVAWNRYLTDGEQNRAIALMARRQGVTLPSRTAKTRIAVPAPGAVGGRTSIL